MKVGKHYLGKIVEVRWSDPNYGKVDLHHLKKGREALASWKEYGYVHDITDGVVVLVHSYGTPPTVDDPDAVCYTSLPEEVIDSITVLVPDAEQKG